MAAKRKAPKKKAAKKRAASKIVGDRSVPGPTQALHEYKRPVGRPTVMTDEIQAEVLERICCGESVATICRDDHMPSISTVIRYTTRDPAFRQHYEAAREIQAEAYFAQVTDIADTTGDPQTGRLRIDARKWVLARMNPKRYGDKAELTLGGDADRPIKTEQLSEISDEDREQLKRIGQRLATKGKLS